MSTGRANRPIKSSRIADCEKRLAPRAWAAMEDLLGGPDRVEQEPGAGGGAVWSNQLAGNFGSAEDRSEGVEGWEPPDARDANGVPTGGW